LRLQWILITISSLNTFCLIWLDANSNEGRNTEQKLRSIINQLKKFQNLHECQDFLKETSSKDRLIFIVSGRLGREILSEIHHLRQMISIYIYCMDKQANELWSSKYSKVKHVVTNHHDFISRIEKKIEEPLSINIFSVGGKSTVGLNGKNLISIKLSSNCWSNPNSQSLYLMLTYLSNCQQLSKLEIGSLYSLYPLCPYLEHICSLLPTQIKDLQIPISDFE